MRISSNPQLRAAHKELLLMRAELERAELGEAMGKARKTVTRPGWLRFLAPIVMGLCATARKKGIGERLRQYPWVSSSVALLLARPLGARLKPVFKLAGLALTAWEAWRIWQQSRQGNVHDTQSSAAEKETG